MRKYIKASVNAIASRFDVKSENIIEVVLSLKSVKKVAASAESNIKPLSNKPEGGTEKDRVYNIEAVAEFHRFCKDVENIVESMADVVESTYSSRSPSYYLIFFSKNKDGSVRERFMFFIRVSDHELDEIYKELVMEYRLEAFKQHKRPNTSTKDGIRYFDFRVNNETHKSYEGALTDVTNKIKGMIKRNK